MRKIQCTKILKFDAGHRVVNHESKCRTLHGHEYKAEITCEMIEGELDSLGRVIDFSVIKEKFGSWIDEHLDHAMIIAADDCNLPLLQQCEGLKPVHVVLFNPTAENLAGYLLKIGNDILNPLGVRIVKIKLWETSSAFAEVFND